jgi:hypothetical protein
LLVLSLEHTLLIIENALYGLRHQEQAGINDSPILYET